MDKPWKVILAFTGIFFAGTVTGVLVAPRLFQKVVERRGQPPGSWTRSFAGQQQQPQLGPQLFRRITVQLDLKPEQLEKINPIEQRTIEELRKTRRESQRTTEQIIEKMQEEVAATLTPEQRVKFDELVAKSRERMQNFLREQEQRNRGGGRRGGDGPSGGNSGNRREAGPRDGSSRDGSSRDSTPSK